MNNRLESEINSPPVISGNGEIDLGGVMKVFHPV